MDAELVGMFQVALDNNFDDQTLKHLIRLSASISKATREEDRDLTLSCQKGFSKLLLSLWWKIQAKEDTSVVKESVQLHIWEWNKSRQTLTIPTFSPFPSSPSVGVPSHVDSASSVGQSEIGQTALNAAYYTEGVAENTSYNSVQAFGGQQTIVMPTLNDFDPDHKTKKARLYPQGQRSSTPCMACVENGKICYKVARTGVRACWTCAIVGRKCSNSKRNEDGDSAVNIMETLEELQVGQQSLLQLIQQQSQLSDERHAILLQKFQEVDNQRVFASEMAFPTAENFQDLSTLFDMGNLQQDQDISFA